jgi:hypothetical protein
MTSKEYYKSTRMVETRNWTLEMALSFAEEYAEALRQPLVIKSVCTCMAFHKSDECYKLGCKAHRSEQLFCTSKAHNFSLSKIGICLECKSKEPVGAK